MLERIAPFLAALGYGGWSAYANLEYGAQVATFAFLVQGGFAFTSTWLLGSMIIGGYRFFSCRMPAYVGLAVFLSGSVFLWSVPLVLHLAAGTPEILMAMLPGLIIGHSYLCLILKRQHAVATTVL